ncbi:MAG TPA: D-alanine--D-alanine ligase [Candidatus Pacebacteria bacterium]|uniref:D-alanine--D-alanine ligase n=1 Tax=Candidatus Gottesmanbacteria bacterium GW2011_GWA2_47_9 TaxID=1618445 RepID=A0A0G1TVI6_9BACT|nr:MAG: D-alanine-D-alanine ligase [Microgenomates group bacterium GW2011_GWB1_45_17]KKU23896.1 MAG: D-alanine-D-alanine ligase [Microgenomates group bacterium GW2011_GWA1_46_15]KKU24711.1 MAG: D-alanine-D-alanine ligase [Microgenomates group bacterium GW2011_GWC1_46_15]KKU85872.1 MAG: D-alanine-D-alanine ligase [Candidatus Gottesmanbacteria bacterium GW2011_GWA2_47_9]HAV15144.1 D-alanine--D-alanine ligase [Candidatus Paceibacterota bacterium]
MKKLRLGVIFGSRSVEHEVSVITAVQLMKNVDRTKYDVVPVYIDKNGRWLTGPKLEFIETYRNLDLVQKNEAYPLLASPDIKLLARSSSEAQQSLGSLDAAIICCHGTLGEDGTVQGLLELANIPYQGPGVLGSAVCMDKIITKQVLASARLPILPYEWFTAKDWKEHKQDVLKKLLSHSYPLYVKPANLGSSVGITKATDQKSLLYAIEVALHFDRRVVVEEEAPDCIELNVSVLGFQDLKASVLEQPVKHDEILSYADKYQRGGGKKSGMASLDRRIPAPVSPTLSAKVQEAAKTAFTYCDCSGVVRIDFFANPTTEEFWINEINTIPGSMSFYLWQASGMPYSKLIDELVRVALERKKTQEGWTRSIATNILKK